MNRARLALTAGISTSLVFLSFAGVAIPQEEEQQKHKATLELIWEKEFPEAIVDAAFDEERDGLFCPTVVVTGNNENARAILFLDNTGETVKLTKLKEWTQVRISENGKYLGIMHPEKYDGEFHYGPVDIIDMSGKLVKKIEGVYGSWWWVSPTGDEVIVKDVWADDDIYYFRGTPGKSMANLTKHKGDISMFAGMPAIKWTGTDNRYLQIGSRGVIVSPDGEYVAILKYVAKADSYVNHLLLYTKDGALLKDFNLNRQGSLRTAFSPDSRFLVASIQNVVFQMDVEERKILWRCESDDPRQVLNVSSTIAFPPGPPFYVAGVFHHHEHMGPKRYNERIAVLSREGEVVLDTLISETLDTMGTNVLRASKKGDMLCFASAHKIRVFQLWRTK